MSKWEQKYDGDWGGYALNKPVHIACCNCGQVHTKIFRIYPKGSNRFVSGKKFSLVNKGYVNKKKTAEWTREKKRRETPR